MILTAEYVSDGHPDRLCDAIVNNIVNTVVKEDKDALCGLECAVHTNKVFVDGRIAAGKDEPVIIEEDIRKIVKDVYHNAGYRFDFYLGKSLFHPTGSELEIILDVCIETLSDDERDLRKYSDDQNVVNGYAVNTPETDYLPIAHYVAITLGEKLNYRHIACGRGRGRKCGGNKEVYALGPDFKILVQLEKENDKYKWHRLTLSIQQSKETVFEDTYATAKCLVDDCLHEVFNNTELNTLATIENDKFYLNGAGDFIQGGPEGDNGLSGKKLCIDFYGPSIPIGGGAIYGKDPHKIDVCGALRARELAVKLVKEHGFYSVFTTLAWSPGEESPYIIEAYEIDEFGTKFEIDNSLLPPKDFFSIECTNNDLKLDERKITSIKDIK